MTETKAKRNSVTDRQIDDQEEKKQRHSLPIPITLDSNSVLHVHLTCKRPTNTLSPKKSWLAAFIRTHCRQEFAPFYSFCFFNRAALF